MFKKNKKNSLHKSRETHGIYQRTYLSGKQREKLNRYNELVHVSTATGCETETDSAIRGYSPILTMQTAVGRQLRGQPVVLYNTYTGLERCLLLSISFQFRRKGRHREVKKKKKRQMHAMYMYTSILLKQDGTHILYMRYAIHRMCIRKHPALRTPASRALSTTFEIKKR